MRRTVANISVANVWMCEDCKEEIDIFPDYYETNGTPVCGDCDKDMVYLHTDIIE